MIIIKDKEHTYPFVRDMIVQSLTRAGVKPWQAHSFSKELEDELIAKETEEITRSALYDLIYLRLGNVNQRAAERFKAWLEIKKGDKEPIIILIGGGTGVGTSTVGTEVAHRLGIKNIIATDSIRQIMRKTVSEKLLPTLHASSYEAYKSMNVSIAKEKDKVLTGFRLQCAEVNVGIEAIIERALKEGTPTLIEGLHVVPGFLSKEVNGRHNVLIFMLHVKDEKEHKNRIYSRALESKFRRSVDSYIENFNNIREIQKFIKKSADNHKVPVLENKNSETMTVEIIDSVIDKMAKQNMREDG